MTTPAPFANLNDIVTAGQSTGLLPSQMATSAPDLTDLSYYVNRSLGGVGAEEVNSERGRNFLRTVQQYDPNASWQPVYGGEGNLTGYSLSFDGSKLPGQGGQSAYNTHGSGESPGASG